MDSIMSIFRCCKQKVEIEDNESLCIELNINSFKCTGEIPPAFISSSSATSPTTSPDPIPPKSKLDLKGKIEEYSNASQAAIPANASKQVNFDVANRKAESCKSLCSTITTNNLNKSNFLGSFNIGSFNQSDHRKNGESANHNEGTLYYYSFSYGGNGTSIKREQKLIDNGILKKVLSLDSTFKSVIKGEYFCNNYVTMNIKNHDLSKFI